VSNETFEGALRDVLNGILGLLDDDREAHHAGVMDKPVIVDALKKLAAGDAEGFHHTLIHPLSEFTDTVLKRGLPNSHEARFIFKNSRFLAAHIRNIVEIHEGMACCADKTRTIISALVQFYMTGKPITFDYSQQYTFHLPTKVFINHDQIIEFFSAVYSLYYGRYELYSAILTKLQPKP
jgi:hypothetical protein